MGWIRISLLLLFACAFIFPADLTVGPDKDYQTIADAYAAAANGDTVVIDAGTYAEATINLAKNVSFRSASGLTDVIWQGGSRAYNITADLTGTLTIQNIRFQGFTDRVLYNYVASRTAGLTLNVQNCEFDGGLEVVNRHQGAVNLTGCTIANITNVMTE